MMQLVTANGISHAYQWSPSRGGTPVALVSGMGGTASFWQPQLTRLSKSSDVLTYDQRGTGATEHVKVKDIEQLATDFVCLLDGLGIDKVHFVGHSTGGAIGMAAAIAHPTRFESLTLYASVHRADAYRRRVWGLRKRILRTMGPEEYARTTSLFFYPPTYIAEHSKALEAMEEIAAKELGSPDVMASRIDAILAFDVAAKLQRIRTRTLVLCARDDVLTPAYFSKEIANLIPGAELALFDWGGHAVSRSRPEEFGDAVESFFARLGMWPSDAGVM